MEPRELLRFQHEGQNGTFPSSLLEQHVLLPGEWIAWVHGPFRHWEGSDFEGPAERFPVAITVAAGDLVELHAVYDPDTGRAGAALYEQADEGQPEEGEQGG